MPRIAKNDFPALTAEELLAATASKSGQQFPGILTVEQAAELMQVPKATIYEWSSRGYLTKCSQRVGKHLRILRDRFVKQVLERSFKGR